LTDINKIKKAFKNSISIDLNNHISNHWKWFLDKKEFDFDQLQNFRNNDLSKGHDDSNYINEKSFKILVKKILEIIDKEFFEKNLKKNNVGNLKNLFDFEGKKIDPGDISLIKYLYDLEKNIFKKDKIEVVCEIGGGYGGFAEKILNNFDIKFISIDLPQTNILSTYYLSKNFPNKKIFTLENNHKEINQDILNNYDILILPPTINFVNFKVDLFINTRSMMEMNKSIIAYYFKFIEDNINKNGYFFNSNRYVKKSLGEAVYFKDYPYDKKWQIISSKKTFAQEHIHQLITKRHTTEEYYDEFIKELENISNETLNYIQW